MLAGLAAFEPQGSTCDCTPALGLQLHSTMPGFCFLTWVLGITRKSSRLQGKHLPHRAIPPVPDMIFFPLNLALDTIQTNYITFCASVSLPLKWGWLPQNCEDRVR